MSKRKRSLARLHSNASASQNAWWEVDSDQETPGAAQPKPAVSKPALPQNTDVATPDTLRVFASFKVLPVTMPPLRISSRPMPLISHHQPTLKSLDVTHHLLLKRHESRNAAHNDSVTQQYPADRTLFVANIPVDATLSHFRSLFSRCGAIETAYFHRDDNIRSNALGRTAHLVFDDESGVDTALEMKPRQRFWSAVVRDEDGRDVAADTQDHHDVDMVGHGGMVQLGLAKWQQEQDELYPPVAALLSRVTHELELFEQAQRDAHRAAKSKRNVPDEDGFVLVTRASKRKTATDPSSGATVTAAKADEVRDLKPKKRELQNFYRFQVKEKKMTQLSELRKKFDEDKVRIAALKSGRKFRPY
ncbi:hypothetical protein SeLEV6574_g01102 [Synchytrium endobioticum]|nr:hypothetical protein SeLEV6574_g01102 [Synchytrium endobioticum]